MRTDQIAYLECKNVGCRQPIWLPRSSQLDRPLSPLDSDDPLAEIYVCPACGHAYEYRALSVHWMNQFHTAAPKNLWGLSADAIALQCDQSNCGVLVLLRKTTDERCPNAEKLLKDAESWTLVDVHCSNGHRVNRIPPDSPVVRVSPA